MASKAVASTALLLSLNLIFFNLVSSTYYPPSPPSQPELKGYEPHHPNYPPTVPAHPEPAKCDTLKLGVCADLFKDLLSVRAGIPPHSPCCSLINGLVDFQAAVCLCTAIKASLLGINLSVPIDLSLSLNHCGKQIPEGFVCA